jgi:hypothetical protein
MNVKSIFIMNCKFGKIWKEAVTAYFKLLFLAFAWRDWRKPRNILMRTARYFKTARMFQ